MKNSRKVISTDEQLDVINRHASRGRILGKYRSGRPEHSSVRTIRKIKIVYITVNANNLNSGCFFMQQDCCSSNVCLFLKN